MNLLYSPGLISIDELCKEDWMYEIAVQSGCFTTDIGTFVPLPSYFSYIPDSNTIILVLICINDCWEILHKAITLGFFHALRSSFDSKWLTLVSLFHNDQNANMDLFLDDV